KDGSAEEEEVEACPAAAADAAQKMGRLGQDRFGADDWTAPGVEEVRAVGVMGLTPVQQRDQCSGVEEELTGHSSETRGCRPDASPPDSGFPTGAIRRGRGLDPRDARPKCAPRPGSS